MKKQKRKNSMIHVRALKIDIDSVYNDIKDAINNRTLLQKQQDELWRKIKIHHYNRSGEMRALNAKIGQQTHQINGCIARLCQYKKTHKAMNLACTYLEKEINRINKIIRYQENNIHRVNTGKIALISSEGITHTDTTVLKKYVTIKKEQRDKLTKWLQIVNKYKA